MFCFVIEPNTMLMLSWGPTVLFIRSLVCFICVIFTKNVFSPIFYIALVSVHLGGWALLHLTRYRIKLVYNITVTVVTFQNSNVNVAFQSFQNFIQNFSESLLLLTTKQPSIYCTHVFRLKKAFDSVNHEILLIKRNIMELGVQQKICFFSTKRQQYVQYVQVTPVPPSNL